MPTENELLLQALKQPYAFKAEGTDPYPFAPQESMRYNPQELTGGVGGADRVGGIQPNLSDPNHIAAYRMARAVAPEQGRQDSGVANMLAGLVPGISPLQQLAGGNYGEATKEAALTALPFGIGKLGRFAPHAWGAWGAGHIMAPESVAGGGLIDSLPKEEQAAYQDRLKQANQIQNQRRRDTEVGKINAEITEKVGKIAASQRELAGNKQADTDWQKANASTIQSLKPEQQSQITGAGNLAERQEVFKRIMKEREESSKTFAEKHAPELEKVRAAAAAVGVGIPALQQFKRAGALNTATQEAKSAWDAASKKGASKATKADLEAKGNILESLTKMPGAGATFAKELGYGTLLPYTAATFTPNALEAAGRFASGTPEDREAGMRAVKALADPVAVGVSLGEGGLATLGGQYLGAAIRNPEIARARAQGMMKTINEQRAVAEALRNRQAASRMPNYSARNWQGTGGPMLANPNVYQGSSPFNLK